MVLPGPKFSKTDLKKLSSDKISSLFGDLFKPLDQYEHSVRIPEPPMLVVDRILGIEGEPGSMAKGTIWSETDVSSDAWYLHHGHMPTSILLEAGQASLLLFSWLGVDFKNQGERVYRLLGCEFSFYGDSPKSGDTLHFKIRVDGHARIDNIPLSFFQFDCYINEELRLKVRNGQAGFFTNAELANSKGLSWNPYTTMANLSLPFDSPDIHCNDTRFDKEQLEKLFNGNVFDCFGTGFENTLSHHRTPQFTNHKMLLIDEVTDFDIKGGPQQRGYMCAVQYINSNDWFFKGHFKNDPCMPWTLLFEAGLQALAFYMTALGFTITRDGWRFVIVPEQINKFSCRGQVIPSNKLVAYEIFITSVISQPIPKVYADVLGTVDGLPFFHTNIGLQLIPDWPLNKNDPLILNHVETKPNPVINEFKVDYGALLAAALGKPSDAFGNYFKALDNNRRVPRLPNIPFHFISRVVRIDAELGKSSAGGTIEFEYDVPPDAWYFRENSFSTMPFCILLESALQPCGWLSMYKGTIFEFKDDLLFRNLDGLGTLTEEIFPYSGTIRTLVTNKSISKLAGMVIESFKVESFLGDKCIFSVDAVFGFFPKAAFENQTGLPVPEAEKTVLQDASDFFIDLTNPTCQFLSGNIRLPVGKLLMIDRITGFWPAGGVKNKGRLRAEKDVNGKDWFFKAHFFQDPVQPGSLGIEAMLQLLQFYMLEQNMHIELKKPRFEPLALNCSLSWKYRGQVIPSNKMISIVVDIIENGFDERGSFVIAEGSLWVDGKRIYETKNMGMRLVEQPFLQ